MPWQLIGFLLLGGLAVAIVFLSAASYSRLERVTGEIVLDTGVRSLRHAHWQARLTDAVNPTSRPAGSADRVYRLEGGRLFDAEALAPRAAAATA